MGREKNWILVAGPVVAVVALSAFLQVTVLSNAEAVKVWLESFGVWFLAAYVIVQTITIVIAPIGGSFIWLPMLAIMGPAKGLLITYLVTTPAYCVNFYLAKGYGRDIVRRFVGAAALSKIDHVAADAGVETLVIFKVFQGGYFDFVSYAAGLTKISWGQFLVVNFLGGIPGSFITYFVLSRFENFLLGVLAMYGVAGLMIAFAVYLHHLRRKHKLRS
ncbi:MAG: DedA family protein [Microgenomates group bacterium GW2011_GWA1_48_10]|nr:MAG: DedA family protein [Microgenomates group bacterium GW2011_GWA1_48_10]